MDIDSQGGDGTVSAVAVAGASAGRLSETLPLDAQMGNANGADWQEEVYQKIKSMREMYLSELNDVYQKIASKVQQGPQNEQIEKLKMFKMTLERILLFLRLNKHDIQLTHKEKLLPVEKHISFFLSGRPCKPTSSPLQGQLPQSSMQLQQPQSLDGQTNPPMQPVHGSMVAMQQNNLTNLQHLSLSGVSTIYNSQQHMINTVQPGSSVATAILPHNPVNSPQQVNISSLSSQSGTNPMQANLGSLQQNSSIPEQSFFELHEQQMLQNQQLREMQQQPFHIQQIMQHQQLFHTHQLMQQQQQAMQQQTVQLRAHLMSQLHQMTDDSSAQMGNTNGADWQEEVYQKIKSMRETYLSEINDLYQKIASAIQQRPQHEKIEKLKMFKMTLERIVLFLRLNKHEIQLSHKEKLFSVERHISFFLSYKRPHKLTSSPLEGQLPQPSMRTSQVQNTYAHQTPTMDSGGQDIASEFDRLLSLID